MEEIKMFNSGLGFGLNNKAGRVADQVDSEAKAGLLAITNVKTVAQQFDFVEATLQQIAQMAGQDNPMLAMQFQQMQQQINNIQTQIVNGLNSAEQSFRTIDSLTDKIQA